MMILLHEKLVNKEQMETLSRINTDIFMYVHSYKCMAE
uniref:Uncharacterized protein n=1 Tax=Vibrio tasmaniensis TaxID=212663 RepID=A0A0H3ZW57_9VIBR|nr:hypothetical protein [Vibrio tasmaniensis]